MDNDNGGPRHGIHSRNNIWKTGEPGLLSSPSQDGACVTTSVVDEGAEFRSGRDRAGKTAYVECNNRIPAGVALFIAEPSTPIYSCAYSQNLYIYTERFPLLSRIESVFIQIYL